MKVLTKMDSDSGVSGPLRNILKPEDSLKSSERCSSGQSHPWNCEDPATSGPVTEPSALAAPAIGQGVVISPQQEDLRFHRTLAWQITFG